MTENNQQPYNQQPYNQQPYNQQPYQQNPYQQPQWAHPNVPFGLIPETMRPSVGFKEAVRLWSKNILTFNGRASQSEFWWVIGPLCLLGIISFVALYFAFFAVMMREVMAAEANGTASTEPPGFFFVIIAMCGLFALLTLLATLSTLSLGWRRLQDAGFPGALWLLVFISIIIPLILAFFPSSPNGLRYETGAVKS